MTDRSLEHVRIYSLDAYAPGDTATRALDDAQTRGLHRGRPQEMHVNPDERADNELRVEPPEISDGEITDLEEGRDGVFYVPDETGSGRDAPPQNRRGRGGNGSGSGGDGPQLWKSRDPGDRRPHPSGRLIVAGLVTASVTGLAVSALGAVDSFEAVAHGYGTPHTSESGPLQHALQPEAEQLAERAIKLTLEHRDGFHATQDGQNEVDVQAGSDSFQDGITFTQPKAGFIDVKLVAPGIDVSSLTEGDAADVQQVYAQETEGIPDSGASAIDTQLVLANPAASEQRDLNNLVEAGDHAGQEWSGIWGVDNDRTANGYVGYGSDPNAVLTGPGPNGGEPMFDSGYWGGGTPPQQYADNGNASQLQTAKDVAAKAHEVFSGALRDIREQS